MKNIAGCLMLAGFAFACSPTNHTFHSSKRPTNESAAAVAVAGDSYSGTALQGSPVYASSQKVISIHENNTIADAPAPVMQTLTPQQEQTLNEKITLAQMDIVHKIEMDRAVSSVALKKVMQRKVVTTEVITLGDSSSSSAVVSRDTLYTAPNGEGTWHTIE